MFKIITAVIFEFEIRLAYLGDAVTQKPSCGETSQKPSVRSQEIRDLEFSN